MEMSRYVCFYFKTRKNQQQSYLKLKLKLHQSLGVEEKVCGSSARATLVFLELPEQSGFDPFVELAFFA